MKKRLLGILMVGMILVGCTPSKDIKTLKVLTPNGAPALALISTYEDINDKGEVRIVEGSELVSAELIKSDSDYDVIIAPINLGCQLIEKEKTDYRLAGVLTWGNLYVVENESVKNNQLAAFGEQAVPGKILDVVKGASPIIKDAHVTYYQAVSDVQAQVLAGKYQYALLAEPAATATLANSKTARVPLKMVVSLQELYQKQMGSSQTGYPQAAVFVKDKAAVQDFLTELDTFTNSDAIKEESKIAETVERIGTKVFGVPNADIVVKTWERQNIHYKDAKDIKDDISSLLQQFGIVYSDDMLAK